MHILNKEWKMLNMQPIENDIKIIKNAEYVLLNKNDLTKLYTMNTKQMEMKIANMLSLLSLVD